MACTHSMNLSYSLNEPIKDDISLTTELTKFPFTSLVISDSTSLSSTIDASCNNSSNNSNTFVLPSKHSDLCTLWHRRLGHPSIKVLRHVMNSCTNLPHIKFCTACQFGKSRVLLHPSSYTKTKHPL